MALQIVKNNPQITKKVKLSRLAREIVKVQKKRSNQGWINFYEAQKNKIIVRLNNLLAGRYIRHFPIEIYEFTDDAKSYIHSYGCMGKYSADVLKTYEQLKAFFEDEGFICEIEKQGRTSDYSECKITSRKLSHFAIYFRVLGVKAF